MRKPVKTFLRIILKASCSVGLVEISASQKPVVLIDPYSAAAEPKGRFPCCEVV